MKRIAIYGIVAVILMGCSSEKERVLSGHEFSLQKAQTKVIEEDALTRSLTIDMFIMLHQNPSSYISLIAKSQNELFAEFNLLFRRNQILQWNFGDGDSKVAIWGKKDELFPLNQWVRLTSVRDYESNELKVYLDGVLMVNKKLKKLPNASKTKTPIVINPMGRKNFRMTIADVRIWSKALSEEEIEGSWNYINNPKKDKDLLAYWLFQDIQNGIIHDLSSSGWELKLVE